MARANPYEVCMRSSVPVLPLVSLSSFIFIACKTTEPAPQKKQEIHPAPVAVAPASTKPKDEGTATDDKAVPELRPLYFDFNAHALDEPAQQHLSEVAAYLRSSPATTVVIAGHADERGTPEYNLALGDMRARAARDYLVHLGVQPSQIRIQSYGEEKPAVGAHGEDAWARNRRDELSFGG